MQYKILRKAIANMIFFLALFLCENLQAQSASNQVAIEISRLNFAAKTVVPPAPEAAELGKYGNVPVSLFTGTPEVGIPLYELKGAGISVPISLSYNASGFNPQSVSTWVGLGWSLGAGGVITRSVQGNPDGVNNYFTNPSPFVVPSHSELVDFSLYKRNIQDGLKETKPDIYFFNFAGRAGKFYIYPDKSIFKKEKDNIKIEHCIDCTDSYFKITDESGTIYLFSKKEITTQIDDDEAGALPSRQYVYPSAWYLSSITSADGAETIDFEYHASTNLEQPYSNIQQNKSVSYTKIGYLNGAVLPEINQHVGNPPSVGITRLFLKRINYKRNSLLTSYVELVSAPGLRQDVTFTESRVLQQLKVFSYINNTAKLIKQINLTQGYFAASSNPVAKHLRLDAVVEVNVDGSSATMPAHSFEYNANISIPPRSTASLDHWGFYNASGNTSLVPGVTYIGQTYGHNANREPSLEGSLCTLLKRINYPTGGYSTFDYELHKGENNEAVGGVRIKEIIDYSFSNNKAVSKKYEYKLDNGNSSGKSNRSLIKYHSVTYFHHYITGATYPEQGDYDNTINTVSATSMFALGSVKGSHIFYSQVTEYLSDVVNNEPLGKTVYNYEVRPLPFDEYDDDIGNGDLKKKRIYDNAGKIIYELNNTYNYLTSEVPLLVHVVKPYEQQTNRSRLCKKVVAGQPVYEWYLPPATITGCVASGIFNTRLNFFVEDIAGQYKQLVAQTEKVYDQSSATYQVNTKKITYGSSAHTYPTTIEQNGSSNDLVVTIKKYSGDYSLTGGSPDLVTAGLILLKNKNINGAVIETQQYRKNNDGSNVRYIGGALTTYLNAKPYPEKVYSLDIDQPISALAVSNINNGVFTFNSNYKLAGSFKYNSSGNLIEQFKANDAISSYIWDYNNMLPVASVVNASSAEIAYTGFETASVASWQMESVTFNSAIFIAGNRSGVLAATGRVYKLFQTTHQKPFVLSYWSRSGALIVTYNGSINAPGVGFNQKNGWTYYQHAIPTGMNQVQIKSAVTATIDELRLFPKDALMTTMSYNYLVGITTQNPPAQDLAYYEYDGFNRLKNLKDNNGSIVKNYVYNYGTVNTAIMAPAATLWYNAAAQQNYTRQGCPTGSAATTVAYKVPYGKYVSSISLADANAKAIAEINANGQAYANANAQCLFWNQQKSKIFVRSNCTPEQGLGWKYTYVVSANTYSSSVSQAAADALAQADIDANGQNAANLHGTCTCEMEDKKMINGVCETGVRNNISTSLQPNGQWKCTYQYIFSNGTTKGPYTSYGTSACPVAN